MPTVKQIKAKVNQIISNLDPDDFKVLMNPDDISCTEVRRAVMVTIVDDGSGGQEAEDAILGKIMEEYPDTYFVIMSDW